MPPFELQTRGIRLYYICRRCGWSYNSNNPKSINCLGFQTLGTLTLGPRGQDITFAAAAAEVIIPKSTNCLGFQTLGTLTLGPRGQEAYCLRLGTKHVQSACTTFAASAAEAITQNNPKSINCLGFQTLGILTLGIYRVKETPPSLSL